LVESYELKGVKHTLIGMVRFNSFKSGGVESAGGKGFQNSPAPSVFKEGCLGNCCGSAGGCERRRTGGPTRQRVERRERRGWGGK